LEQGTQLVPAVFPSVETLRFGKFDRSSLCIAKSFFLVSGACCCVASTALQKKKGSETKSRTLFLRGDGMTLQVRINALAAFLSFGFVIAVVLGMI
jgi:hypothetical protein